MSHAAVVTTSLLSLLVGMVLLLEVGVHFRRRRLGKPGGDNDAGLGPLEGAIFGLLGLLLAFTFSGAANRFDAGRQLILQEANAMGTAYLRLDLLPPAAQPALRDTFRTYVDTRLQGFRLLPDEQAAEKEFARARTLQGELWRRAVTATRDAPDAASARLLLPALNEMYDVATARALASETHAPFIIYAMLGILALVCSFLAGETMAKGGRIGLFQRLAFPLIFVITLYVILDLEYPRTGLIRISGVDQLIVEVRDSMK